MAHYLDPKNDLTFKRVFGEHKHLCMSLINSMLPLEKPIVSIEYQTGELIPEIPGLRKSIVDVRCTDKDKRELLENELTREAVEYMERSAYTKEQLDAYDKWKIDAMTERGAINDAKREGEAIGEQKKAVAVALKVLKKGMSIEDASDISGLSKEQIEGLG